MTVGGFPLVADANNRIAVGMWQNAQIKLQFAQINYSFTPTLADIQIRIFEFIIKFVWTDAKIH